MKRTAIAFSVSLVTALPAAALAQAGQAHRGYNRKEVTQLQTTFTHFIDQVLGAERMTLVGEIGYTRIGGLESLDKVRYGRDAIYGGYNDASAIAMNGRHGFYTSGSWIENEQASVTPEGYNMTGAPVPSLDGMVDVEPLNRVREQRGLEPVEAQQ